MISVNNLKFDYGKDFKLNIEKLNIEENLLNVIIGPNGSGKSTFVKLLSGLLQNFQGNIEIDGSKLSELNHNVLSKKITYMNRRLIRNYDISVFDFVSFGRFPHKKNIFFDLSDEDMKILSNTLEKVDLKNKTNKMLYELSDGEIQRAYLAKILCQETKYTVLDEPTTNLDIRHISEFLQLIKELKHQTTFIIILHDINEALDIFDKMIAFNHGKIDFVWKGLKDFDLQKLINLYSIDLKCFSDNEKYIVYL